MIFIVPCFGVLTLTFMKFHVLWSGATEKMNKFNKKTQIRSEFIPFCHFYFLILGSYPVQSSCHYTMPLVLRIMRCDMILLYSYFISFFPFFSFLFYVFTMPSKYLMNPCTLNHLRKMKEKKRKMK